MDEWRYRRGAVGMAFMAALLPIAAMADEPAGDIVIADSAVFPENIASSRDGTVWFGSVAKGTIYCAQPGSKAAQAWIASGTGGMKQSMGLWADAKRGLLWVCAPGARATADQPAEATAIKSFDLRTGAFRASFGFEGGGRCNDLTIARDGSVCASDFDGGRIMRLARGGDRFRPWATDLGAGVDGIVQLADGALYVNNFKTGALVRVPVQADGTAGKPVTIATGRPLVKPDGMRAVGAKTLLLVEGEGRLVELTIDGDGATIHLLKGDLPDSPTGVTLVGNTAYVVQAKWAAMREPANAGSFGAVAISYTLPKAAKSR